MKPSPDMRTDASPQDAAPRSLEPSDWFVSLAAKQGRDTPHCLICPGTIAADTPLHCSNGCQLSSAYDAWRVENGGPADSSVPHRLLGGTSLKNSLLVVRSLGDILSDPRVTQPPEFIIPGLVEAGAVTMLSGAPKAGKSTFASQVAADYSRGRAMLDGTPMRAGRVLWFAIDEPLRRLAQRFPALDADPDNFLIVGRDGERITPELFAAVIERERPALVVIDTLSQLAADNGIKVNDAESVAPFIRALVTAIQAQERCGGLFVFHAPHHASRASGSVQWAAVVDATLVLRRPAARTPTPGESPDDDEHVSSEDGRRILEGVTRWGGEQRTLFTYRDGRYAIGTGAAPLIDRLRWALLKAQPGPEVTSGRALAKLVRARDVDVADAIRELVNRGEAKVIGTGRRRYIEPTAAIHLYAGGEAEAMGSAGEMDREEKESEGDSYASRIETPVPARGRRKEFAPPADDDGHLTAVMADEPTLEHLHDAA